MSKAQITEIHYKFNTPRARWNQAPNVAVGHMFSPNYRRKYIFSNGQEVIREVGQELFDDATGLIPEVDGND